MQRPGGKKKLWKEEDGAAALLVDPGSRADYVGQLNLLPWRVIGNFGEVVSIHKHYDELQARKRSNQSMVPNDGCMG